MQKSTPPSERGVQTLFWVVGSFDIFKLPDDKNQIFNLRRPGELKEEVVCKITFVDILYQSLDTSKYSRIKIRVIYLYFGGFITNFLKYLFESF